MYLLLIFLWSEDIVVSKGYTSYPGQHCMFCDEYHNVNLVWFKYEVGISYRIFYNQYLRKWKREEDLTEITTTSLANYPAIAGTTKNNIIKMYAVWESGSLYSDIVLRKFVHDAWLDEIIYISKGTKYTYTPSIICDTEGNLHIVYEKNFEICYRKYNGEFLSDEIILSNSGVYAAYPSITSFDNKLFVVWQDLRDGNFEIYFREFDGTEWMPEKRITNSYGASMFPSLCVDSFGVVHIVYQEDTLGGYRIFYVPSTNFSPKLIINSPGEAITPSITSTKDGLHIVWSDSRDGNYEIYYKNLLTFELKRLTTAKNESANPTITNDKIGNLYVVFWDKRDDTTKVYFKEKRTSKPDKKPSLFATPNPFTTKTKIFSNSDIKIFDLSGRLVATLRNEANIIWEGKDNYNRKIPPGVYFLKNKDSLYKLIFLGR